MRQSEREELICLITMAYLFPNFFAGFLYIIMMPAYVEKYAGCYRPDTRRIEYVFPGRYVAYQGCKFLRWSFTEVKK